jgi:hypothetical protein
MHFVNQFTFGEYPVAERIAGRAISPQEYLVCAVTNLLLGDPKLLARSGVSWPAGRLPRGSTARGLGPGSGPSAPGRSFYSVSHTSLLVRVCALVKDCYADPLPQQAQRITCSRRILIAFTDTTPSVQPQMRGENWQRGASTPQYRRSTPLQYAIRGPRLRLPPASSLHCAILQRILEIRQFGSCRNASPNARQA